MNRKIPEKTITVVGMGYIGLPTAIIFASAGFLVNGYDVNEKTINSLKKGKLTIVEPYLDYLFSVVLNKKLLRPTTEMVPADIYIICVSTPYVYRESLKKADLSHVRDASRTVGRILRRGDIVILESTVPPETTERVMLPILSQESGIPEMGIPVAHCPERILPGNMLHELRNNDRIIGASSMEVGARVKELYETVVTEGHIYLTDCATAELCKLVENTYRDVNIAFANELSMICDDLGIDVWNLISLANKHPRVSIMWPGPGVGGHCLAVDPWFIVERLPDNANLIKKAREVNDNKPHWVIDKVKKDIEVRFTEEGRKITVGVLGLAYKPDIDDFRESPAMTIACGIRQAGYHVIASDPYAKIEELDGIPLMSMADTVEAADYLVYAVSHRKFREAHALINSKPCFDAVGVLSR